MRIISIHAPLRGRLFHQVLGGAGFFISIHAPLRGRHKTPVMINSVTDFNPRPLAGATAALAQIPSIWQYFNPRPLAGATSRGHAARQRALISIHAPLRGRQGRGRKRTDPANFNPRPLAGATTDQRNVGHRCTISIHAPLRGRPVSPRIL